MRTHDWCITAGRWSGAAAAAGVMALLLPLTAAGQGSGGEVLRAAMDHYEARLEGVDSVTIVQQATTPMGVAGSQETRLVKVTKDGHSVLVPKGENAPEDVGVSTIYSILGSLVDRAVLRGRSEVDGHEVYVVAVTDLRGEDLGQGALGGSGRGTFEPDSAVFYLDTGDYLMRRADTNGSMTMGGSERSVSVRADFRDFRETAGYLHPYRVEVQLDIEGMGKQMKALMQKMQQGDADSAQRAMMKQAMAAMMAGGMTVTTTVEELRVNGGG